MMMTLSEDDLETRGPEELVTFTVGLGLTQLPDLMHITGQGARVHCFSSPHIVLITRNFTAHVCAVFTHGSFC